GDEREPREQHVTLVQGRQAAPCREAALSERDTGETVEPTAGQVTERVTGEGVEREEHDVDRQDERAHADAKMPLVEKRLDRVVPEKGDEKESDVKEVAM